MNRKEAQNTAGKESKNYRPLSLGTMAILQQLNNATLAALLGGGNIAVNYEDFIIFLFIHSKENNLGQIKEMILENTLISRAYDWVEAADPLIIAEGVDYFTETQTRAELVAAGSVQKGTQKKNEAQPQALIYLRALLFHYLNFSPEYVDDLPYTEALEYIHSIMIINGNDTRWLNEDKESTERDRQFINNLDL